MTNRQKTGPRKGWRRREKWVLEGNRETNAHHNYNTKYISLKSTIIAVLI